MEGEIKIEPMTQDNGDLLHLLLLQRQHLSLSLSVTKNFKKTTHNNQTVWRISMCSGRTPWDGVGRYWGGFPVVDVCVAESDGEAS